MGEINRTVDCWPQSAQSLDAVQTLFINRCDINNVLETHPKHSTFQAAGGKLNSRPSTRSNEVFNQTDFLTTFAGSWLTVSSGACRKPLCERQGLYSFRWKCSKLCPTWFWTFHQLNIEHPQLLWVTWSSVSPPSAHCPASIRVWDRPKTLHLPRWSSWGSHALTYQSCQDPSECHPFPLAYQLQHPACCHPQSYRAAEWGNLQEKIRCHPLFI